MPRKNTNLSQRLLYKRLSQERLSQRHSQQLRDVRFEILKRDRFLTVDLQRLDLVQVRENMRNSRELNISLPRLRTDLENNTMVPIGRLTDNLNGSIDLSQSPGTSPLSQELMPPPPVPPPRPLRPPPPPPPPPRRRHALIPLRQNTYKKGLSISNDELEVSALNPYKLGHFNEICGHCLALYFEKEKVNRAGVRLSCCKDGAYELPPYARCPQTLKDLFIGNSSNAIQFRREIRSINSYFAMASFKTSKPPVTPQGQGHWSYSVCGQIYHMYNGVPGADELRDPSLNHFYFLDSDEALSRRNNLFGDRISNEILRIVYNALINYNIYIQAYKTVGEMLREEFGNEDENYNERNIIIGFVTSGKMNELRKELELPESRSEIAAVFHGEEPPPNLDLVLYRRDHPRGHHHELKNLNPLADPMVYPLLFPYGDLGYSTNLYYKDENRLRNNQRKKITFNEYYRYRLHVRDGFSTLHSGGKLFQQFIVNSWIKIETNRLWWIRNHQDNFRIATCNILRRLYNTNELRQLPNIGKSIYLLPSTFQGSIRNRQRQYLDAMSIITRFGKPDLFITMTCNPRWSEIIQNLGPNQKWENRPDLVCRVFHTKLLELMDDLVHKQIFGVVLNYHYVIEFQKRGLPHAHILLTMYPNDKIQTTDGVDKLIHAYMPDKNTQPNLFNLVKEYQVHSPCGVLNPAANCMVNNKCKKFYPKDYKEHTSLYIGDNKRPEYKRPNDGRRMPLNNYTYSITNRRIIPYNPYLLAKFQSHINVEVVGSLYTMKYLYKYINKKSDAVTLYVGDAPPQERVAVAAATPPPATQQRNDEQQRQQRNDEQQQEGGVVTTIIDEIQQYQDLRYVSSMEATWRIMEYHMNDRSHSVLVLPVHLEGNNNIVFNEQDDAEELLNRLEGRSKLEAYFRLNAQDENARRYLYHEIPEHYTWDNTNIKWTRRRQISKQIGCMIEITPSSEEHMELLCLRILLLRTTGATSFQDLKTLENGTICETYKQVCQVKNFLRGTDEFDRAMAEAALKCHPRKMRRLFALYMCITYDEGIIEFNQLWIKYRKHLCEDYIVLDKLTEAQAARKALMYIEEIVLRNRVDVEFSLFRVLHLPRNQPNNNNNNVESDSESDSENDENEEDRRRRNNYLNDSYDEDLPNNERRNQRNDDDDDDDDDNNDEETYSPISLNPDQKRIFLRIMKTITQKNNLIIPPDVLLNINDVVSIEDIQEEIDLNENLFYMDGPGGTGKTYLYNTIITCIKKHFTNIRCISVAWTGIAANLLIDGTTVHRAFKLPISLTDSTIAGWDVDNARSINIANTVVLIIWDEAPMSPKLAIEAVDRYLRDIKKVNEPMGGICCLFGGDFRQTLPIVIGGNRHDIINSSLKRSVLWNRIVFFELNHNMRTRRFPQVEENLGNKTYSEWLLDLGDGQIQYVSLNPRVIIGGSGAPNDLVQIPLIFHLENLEQLIDYVYDNDYVGDNNIAQKAILCPTNVAVAHVNQIIIDRMEGSEEKIYYSIDSYNIGPDDQLRVPMDLLNSIESPSLPPHKLILKKGAIVMILKNIDVEDGICNGSRVRVIDLGDNIIECQVITGCNAGRKLYIPKITCAVKDTILPNTVKRFQFPIKLAYAMTINKSQGQSLERVGIFLQKPCFTHGQLYVAFSRVGSLHVCQQRFLVV